MRKVIFALRDLFKPAARLTAGMQVTDTTDETADFPGRIDHRLNAIMGLLFSLILVGGGMSLYLAYYNYLNTEEIRRERERIDLVDQMHDTVHHFVSDLQRAIINGTRFPSSDRTAYMEKFSYLLELYHRGGGGEKEVEEKIPLIIGDLADLSGKFAAQKKNSPQFLRSRLISQHLARLVKAEGMMNSTIERLRMEHRGSLEQKVLENRKRTKLMVGFYGGSFFLGALLVFGSTLFFHRTITRPLRQLAEGASEIADGNLDNTVPVTSNDEIGQLSYTFNFMVRRLREHEARLRALATIEERELVAQELHDSLAQDLAILRLKLDEAEKDSPSGEAVPMKDVLTETRKSVDRTYKDVRQAILGLHTVVSEGMDFVPTLTEYLHNFSEMSKIPVDLDIDSPETVRFSPEVEIQLIRIIHEALTNIFKHAHATRGAVKFERDRDFVKMAIEDNGTGLIIEEGARTGLRFGLQSMRKRAEGIGGKLLIETVVGKGSRVIVHLPFEEGPYGAHSNAPGR
jgi:signal transduction histidine kinase